jgi:hypothetical protein
MKLMLFDWVAMAQTAYHVFAASSEFESLPPGTPDRDMSML